MVVYPVNHLLCSVVCGIFLRHPLFHILLPCPVVVAEGGKLHDEFMPMSRFELHIPVFRHLFHFSDDLFRVGWCRVLMFLSRRGIFSSLTLSGRLAFLFLLLLFVADEVFGLFRCHVNRRGIPLEVGILIVRQTADSGHVGALSVSLQSECFVIQFHRLGDGYMVQVGGCQRTAFGSGVSAQDSDSRSADGPVSRHGVPDVFHLLHCQLHLFQCEVVIVQHEPVGFPSEVFQLFSSAHELDRRADAMRSLLSCLCQHSVYLGINSIPFRILLGIDIFCDEFLQFLKAFQGTVDSSVQRLEKRWQFVLSFFLIYLHTQKIFSGGLLF